MLKTVVKIEISKEEHLFISIYQYLCFSYIYKISCFVKFLSVLDTFFVLAFRSAWRERSTSLNI